jgi:hypothetical protein
MTKEYLVIEDLRTFKESCSSFVNSIEIIDFEYDEDPVAMGCSFKKEEKCGIKSCGQYHKHGFIIKTACGKFYNIGQVCSRSHFGVDFDAWTAGYEAKRKVESDKAALINEPPRKLEYLKKLTPSLIKLERVNHFIWDNLNPIAKEAHERKKDGLYRGLEFIEHRLFLEKKVSEYEEELNNIIQQVKLGESEQDQVRGELLKNLRNVKDKIINIEHTKDLALAFFGTEAGVGVKDRGANLVRVFTNFKCASNTIVKACDVKTELGSIIIPDYNKKVNASGIFRA